MPKENHLQKTLIGRKLLNERLVSQEQILRICFNEAAILAARLNKKAIDMADLEESATRVKLGPEKKKNFRQIWIVG